MQGDDIPNIIITNENIRLANGNGGQSQTQRWPYQGVFGERSAPPAKEKA